MSQKKPLLRPSTGLFILGFLFLSLAMGGYILLSHLVVGGNAEFFKRIGEVAGGLGGIGIVLILFGGVKRVRGG